VTTKFNSFDASPLAAFVQSPLGARNRVRRVRLPRRSFVMVISWLDESSRYASLSGNPWHADLEAWEEVITRRDSERFRAIVFDAPVAPDSREPDRILGPSGLPSHVLFIDVPRHPSPPVTGIIELVRGILGFVPASARLDELRFVLDRSGSFDRVVTDDLTIAIKAMPEEYDLPQLNVTITEGFGERWLQWLAEGIAALVPVQ
jgi:hypothetical protein